MNRTQCVNRSEAVSRPRTVLTKAVAVALAIASLASVTQPAVAGPREQAKRMYDRLTGTPPSPEVLDQLETYVMSHSLKDTALFIVDNANDKRSANFYSVTLKNFATPWTNRDQNVFAPLNDYTATVIGMVRDNKDFRTVLYEDIVYVGNGVSPAFSISDNTSPIPSMRPAMRSGWNTSTSVSFSPTPANLMGLPVTARTDIAAPPRVSPSSLVSTTPVSSSCSLKAVAAFTAS